MSSTDKLLLSDSQMARVPKHEFTKVITFDADLHLRLSNDHYVRVARAGEKNKIQETKFYQDPQVEDLYLHYSDFSFHAKKILSSSLVSAIDATSFEAAFASTLSGLQVVQELLRLEGLSEKSWSDVHLTSTLVMRACEFLQKWNAYLLQIKTLSHTQIKHMSSVAMMTGLLSARLSMPKEKQTNLIMAALLHDIGWSQLPQELLQKETQQLSESERSIYESHPKLGAAIVADCPGANPFVAAYVLTHHENQLGTGYPFRLMMKDEELDCLVLSFSERMTELTLGDQIHQKGRTLSEAIALMYGAPNKPYPEVLFQTLRDFL